MNLSQKTWYLMVLQTSGNIFLVFFLISQYYNNASYHDYVESILPAIRPILAVGLGTISATLALTTYLQLQTARSQEQRPDRTHRTSRHRKPKPSTLQPASAMASPAKETLFTPATRIIGRAVGKSKRSDPETEADKNENSTSPKETNLERGTGILLPEPKRHNQHKSTGPPIADEA